MAAHTTPRRSTGRTPLVTLLVCAVLCLGGGFLLWRWTHAGTRDDPRGQPLTPAATTTTQDDTSTKRVAIDPKKSEVASHGVPSTGATDAGARIEGRVHARGGAAIAGARVRVELATGDESRSLGTATSGPDGEYTLEAPSLVDALEGGGEVRVIADASHFRPGRMVMPLAAVHDAKVVRVDVRLEQGERLTGRVVDGASKPVGDATVVLSVSSTKAGITTFPTVEEVRTGADGHFDLGFVSSTRYHLAARADGRGTAFLGDLDLEAGVARSLGDLVLKGGAAISGTVLHEDGAPVAEFELWAVDGNFANDPNGLALAVLKAPDTERADGLAYTKTLTDSAGNFALRGLRPGQYALRSPDLHAVLEPHQLRFEPGTPKLEMRLLSSRLVVRVVDDHGSPVRAANVRLTELSVLADGSYKPAGVRTQAVHGADAIAAFVLDPETPAAVEAFTATRTSREELAVLSQNESTRELVLVLSAAAGQGRLILDVQGADGHALTNLQVSVLSAITKARQEELGILETDAQGQLPPIPAGTYQLVIGFAPGTDRDHFPLRTSEPVVIMAGEPTTLALRARQGGRVALALELRGTAPPGFADVLPAGASHAQQVAFDAKRRAHFGASVTLTPTTGGAPRALQFRTPARSGIVSEALPGETLVSEDLIEPGTYSVSIEGAAFAATSTSTVRVEAGKSVDVPVAVRTR